MMKTNLKNRKLVSALTIGISAMMTLQTPFTAYASGDIDTSDIPEPDKTQEADQSAQDTYQPVTQEAQDRADDAIEAINDTSSGDEQNAAQDSQELGDAVTESGEAANVIIDNADAGEVSEKVKGAVGDLIDAAKDVAIDDTDENGNADPGAVSQLEDAAGKIADVKKDLADAENANKDAEKAHKTVVEESKEMSDSYVAAAEQAQNMDEVTESAGEKAGELVDSIQNTDDPDAAKQAYEDLEKLVEETKEDLATRKELYDRLAKEYEEALKKLEEAKKALEEAEEKLDGKVKSAADKTDAAKEEVEEAKKKVDNLDKALDVVTDKLEDEKQANVLSNASGGNWSGKFGNVDNNRAVMKKVIANYYLPEVLGIELAKDVDVDKDCISLKGVDGQEYNYTKVTYSYYDENGNVKTATKYFNWDSLTRTSLTDNKLFRTNGNDGIVIFEKSEEEVKVNQIVKEYYEKNNKNVLKDNQRWDAFLRGDFDVYKYVDADGNTQYILKDEMEKSENKDSIVVDDNGNIISYDGIDMSKVVQNSNSLLHDGNCLIISSDKKVEKYLTQNTEVYNKVVTNDGKERLSSDTVKKIIADSNALNAFISGNATSNDAASLVNKYVKYKEETKEAQDAVDKAEKQVDNLADAIADIKSQVDRSNRSELARDVLGTNDLAGLYGLDLDEEEAEKFNNMTVTQLINELNKRKSDADKQVKDAQDRVDKLENKLTDAEEDLNKTLERLAAPEDDEQGGDDNEPGQNTEPDPEGDDSGNQPGGGGQQPGDGNGGEGGENVTPGGENVPGGSDVTPGGENVVPGGDNVPGGSDVTPGGDNVVPGGDAEPGVPDNGGAEPGSESVITDGGNNAPGAGNTTPGTGNNEPGSSSGTRRGGTETGGSRGVGNNTSNSIVSEGGSNTNAAADNGGVAAIAADNAQGGVTILDEGVPMAESAPGAAENQESISTASGQTTVAAETVASFENKTDIEDENSALVASMNEITKDSVQTRNSGMNLWWLLIIAVFGATGEAMYRRHLEKKEEKNQNNKTD